MIVKTKKYELAKKTYIQIALMNILREQWWVLPIPVAIGLMAFIWPKLALWFIITPIVLLALYALFWAVQFAGVTQLEQNQIMFQKLSYEIDSQKIMIKLNLKQGSPIQWNQIKAARMGADHFIFIISKAQFIYLPFKSFNSDHDIKFTEIILKRKGYIKDTPAPAKQEAKKA
jgi:hypothetical protein